MRCSVSKLKRVARYIPKTVLNARRVQLAKSHLTPPPGATQWGEFALGAIGLVAVVVLLLLAPTESGGGPGGAEAVEASIPLTIT
jgi:hypothetical protein